MAKYVVIVLETVRSAYIVEADTAEAARQAWADEGDECGVLDWSVTKDARVEEVNKA